MSETESPDRRERAQPLWLFNIVSSGLTILAIVYIVQRFTQGEVLTTVQKALDYYRQIVHPLIGYVEWTRWIGLPIPKDFFTLSFIGGAAVGRSLVWAAAGFVDTLV